MGEGDGDGTARFELTLPAEPAFVSTARLFASAVARHFGCGEEEVHDVKVAVSEACASALRAGADGGSLNIWATRQGPRLTFEVEGAAVPGKPPRPGAPGEEIAPALGLELIRALFEDARFAPNERGGTNLTFSLPVPPAPV